MSDVRLERVDLDSDVAQRLIALLNAELTDRYPEEGANHFRLDAAEVAPGRGAFLVATLDGDPVACGAVRLIETSVAEIKRMYVMPAARGRGLGRTMLGALEAEAVALGSTRLVLETGDRQPEALGLYESAGFSRIEAYGEYVGSPLSVCMSKVL